MGIVSKTILMLGLGGFVSFTNSVTTSTSATAVANALPGKSKAFKSASGKFSIMFKAKPVESNQDVPTDVGNIKMYMFMHEETASKVYMVAYSDYPAELIGNANASDLLQGSKQGVLGQFQAVTTSEKASKFQGSECLDFTASGETYHTAYKLVLVKNRLYQVAILQTEGPVESNDINAFINSFKIL